MPRRRDPELLRAFGARLRQVRNDRKWTQEQLAEAADLDVVTVSRYETGDKALSIATVAVLARKLGVGVADLLDLDRAPPEPPPIDPEESEIVRLVKAVPPERRELARRLLRELARP